MLSSVAALTVERRYSDTSASILPHAPKEEILTFSQPVEEVLSILQERIEETIPEEEGKHRLHPPRALAIHLMEHDTLDEDIFHTYARDGRSRGEFSRRSGKRTHAMRKLFQGLRLLSHSPRVPSAFGHMH